jgi:hypothetical protein
VSGGWRFELTFVVVVGFLRRVRDGWKWCHEIFRARCVGHELRVCDWCGVASGERR